MKRNLVTMALALCGALSASATLYTGGGFSIPEGGALGSSYIDVIGNTRPEITDVNVTLTFSAGYNADLYGYLVFDNGTSGNFADDRSVVLLNRIGTTAANPMGNAYASSGLTITLSGSGFTDIHMVTGALANNGTYAADGRAVSPLSTGAQFDAATRQNSGDPLSGFNAANPNGRWTLYFADMSSGDASQLTSWGLQITAVPEPVHYAMAAFALIFVGVRAGRFYLARRRQAAS